MPLTMTFPPAKMTAIRSFATKEGECSEQESVNQQDEAVW